MLKKNKLFSKELSKLAKSNESRLKQSGEEREEEVETPASEKEEPVKEVADVKPSKKVDEDSNKVVHVSVKETVVPNIEPTENPYTKPPLQENSTNTVGQFAKENHKKDIRERSKEILTKDLDSEGNSIHALDFKIEAPIKYIQDKRKVTIYLSSRIKNAAHVYCVKHKITLKDFVPHCYHWALTKKGYDKEMISAFKEEWTNRIGELEACLSSATFKEDVKILATRYRDKIKLYDVLNFSVYKFLNEQGINIYEY